MLNFAPDIRRRPSCVLLLRALTILILGAVAGIVYNGISSKGIPLQTPAQASFSDVVNWSLRVEGIRATLADARKAFDRKDTLFLDARPPGVYQAGHIPGARNLPIAEFEVRSGEVLKGVAKDARIITYCSGERCQSSIVLAHRLIESLGYTRTRVFFDGWHAWNAAGYPLAIGDLP